MKKIIFLICLLPSLAFAQIGISTTEPQAMLDINGNLRIQDVPYSTTTNEAILVVDDSGFVKKSVVEKSTFRGYLQTNFEPGTSDPNAIFRIKNFFTLEDDSPNDFDPVDGVYTAPFTGYYSIRMNITSKGTNEANPKNNVVYGLVESKGSETHQWVMRFAIPDSYIRSVGTTSNAGVANSFIGVVKLQKGKQYYFGTTSHVIILSTPSGTTGSGIGTFFEIQLVKSTDS